jgi:hypothetical protein
MFMILNQARGQLTLLTIPCLFILCLLCRNYKQEKARCTGINTHYYKIRQGAMRAFSEIRPAAPLQIVPTVFSTH